MKTTIRFLALAGILTAFAFQAFSQAANTSSNTKEGQQVSTPASTRGTFTDKNNNGVCDNRENLGKTAQGKNFTDANGDGVCDHYQARNKDGKNTGCCGKGLGPNCGKGAGCGHMKQSMHRGGCQQPCKNHSNPDCPRNK